MKTKLKIFIAIGVIAVLLGGMLFVGGMTALGWNFYNLDNEELEAVSLSVDKIDKVELSGDWEFCLVKGQTDSISYYNSSLSDINVATSVVEDNNVLSFKENKNLDMSTIFSINGIRRGRVQVVITYSGDSIDVVIGGSSVDLVASNVAIDSLVMSVTSCDVSLRNTTVNDMKVVGVSTDIELYNSSITALSVDAVSLDLELESCTVGDLNVVATSGDITADDSTIKNSVLKGSSIDVDYENCDIFKIDADATSLKMELELCGSVSDFNSISASGVSSKVVIGNVKGNYNGLGAKSIIGKGGSAKIEVDFNNRVTSL